jgi:serine/threonine protein phosphatase PrpC
MGNTESQPTPELQAMQEPVTTKTTERGHLKQHNLNFAVSGMQGLRPTMEDRHFQSDYIPFSGGDERLDDHAIFAVFDGHGGDFTSNYLEANFLSALSERFELSKYAKLPKTGAKSREDVPGVNLLRQALVRTFVELDAAMIPLQRERNKAILAGKISAVTVKDDDDDEIRPKYPGNSSQGERSGSTGVVVLLTPTHIICANAGDSRAVLRRSGSVLPLSFDHKPSDVPERERIIEAGGVVKGKRVDGDLAVSRAFGDFSYKQENLPVEKQKVVVVPDTIVYPRDFQNDEFMVLGK